MSIRCSPKKSLLSMAKESSIWSHLVGNCVYSEIKRCQVKILKGYMLNRQVFTNFNSLLFVFLKSSLGSEQNWSTVYSNMPPPLPSLIPTNPTNKTERESDLRAFPFSTILSTFHISVLTPHALGFTLDVHFVGFDQSISPL